MNERLLGARDMTGNLAWNGLVSFIDQHLSVLFFSFAELIIMLIAGLAFLIKIPRQDTPRYCQGRAAGTWSDTTVCLVPALRRRGFYLSVAL